MLFSSARPSYKYAAGLTQPRTAEGQQAGITALPFQEGPEREGRGQGRALDRVTPLLGRSRNREKKAETHTALTCGGRFLRLYPAPYLKEFYAFNIAQPERKSQALHKHTNDPHPLSSSRYPSPLNTQTKKEDEAAQLTSLPYLSFPPPRKAHRAPRGFSAAPETLRGGSVCRVTTHQALSGTNRQPRGPLGFVVRSPQLQSPQCNAAAKGAGGGERGGAQGVQSELGAG